MSGYMKVLIILQGVLAGVIACRAIEPRISNRTHFVVLAISLVLAGLFSSRALLEFDNWKVADAVIRAEPVFFMLMFCILQIITLHICFGNSGGAILRKCWDAGEKITKEEFTNWLRALSVGVCIVLAFRYDSLFLGSSELHWAYYVGPAETVRNGGALLWDTPSQYGFLNILPVSVLPISSIWQSFYVTQSIFLVVSSLLVVRTIIALHETNVLTGLGVLLSLIAFFFSDPALIGPQLYPSSSAMRFFPCYLLLALVIKPFRISWLGKTVEITPRFAWIISLFWSVETAFYCTCACVSLLLAQGRTIDLADDRKSYWLCARLFVIWLIFAVAAFFGISALYLVIYGHIPDWTMYWMHVIGYGAGYGASNIPLRLGGALFFLILLFVSSLIALTGSYRVKTESVVSTRIATCAGLLWGVSSYYVGRPVFNNVLALAPILVLCSLTIIYSGLRSPLRPFLSPLQATFVPFSLMLLVATLGNTPFYQHLVGIASFTSNVQTRIHSEDVEFKEAVINIGVDERDLFVYYGDEATAPRPTENEGNFLEATPWLPKPLQLLQDPVPEAYRIRILDRYVARFPNGGYFVYSKNGAAAVAHRDWVQLLDQRYRRIKFYENSRYGAIKYGPK